MGVLSQTSDVSYLIPPSVISQAPTVQNYRYGQTEHRQSEVSRYFLSTPLRRTDS